MESGPLVSICIPVYNGELYIAQAIESVLNQSYENCEIVVVDNASEDDTAHILDKLLSAHPGCIRVFRNPETVGMVENFNIAISFARGEYIKILPHDDMLPVDGINDLVSAAKPGDKLIVGLRSFLFEAPGLKNRLFYFRQNIFWRVDRAVGKGFISPEAYVNAFSGNTCHNIIGEPGSVLMSADALREVGGFDNAFHQLCDLQLWHKLGMQFGLRVVPKHVAYFRVHDSSQSAQRDNASNRMLGECLGLSTFMLNNWNFDGDEGLVCNYLLDRARYQREVDLEPTRDQFPIEARGIFSRALALVVLLPVKRVYQLLLLKITYLVCSIVSGGRDNLISYDGA